MWNYVSWVVSGNSAAKQQISWRSPLTFDWPGVPKQRASKVQSSQSERHLTVFCIDEIVPGNVVYLVNGNLWKMVEKYKKVLRFLLKWTQDLWSF